MKSDAPVLELRDVSRRFGEREVLRRVSFTLEGPSTVGLLGRNGAGKSTALRIVAGALSADGGTLRAFGIDVARFPREARARIGWLAEGAPAHDEQRVEAYLRFRARLRGLGDDAAARAIERCSLESERRTVIAHLSRGYRQRVGLAEALLADPPLLLLDEPTTGLDPAQVRALRGLIASLRGERSVLLSSHALHEVELLCERVLVLHDGALVADDAPLALRQRMTPGRFVVEAKGDGARLFTHVRARLAAIVPEAEVKLEGAHDGVARLVVDGHDRELRGLVASALVEAGAELRLLAPETSSLEAALLPLWRGDDEVAP